MADHTPIKLNIPSQDLQEFSLFALDADAARTWAHSLPVTNTLAVAQQLHQAVSELNRIPLAPEVRYNTLEALRPNLDVALANLSRRFLNQPLIMPEDPREMAELADNLYDLTSTAYTIVAIETIQQRDTIREANPARLTCESIHRALVYTGRKVLQTFQLYRPMGINSWQTLHQLYSLAESQQLADLPVPESLSGGDTIKATYLQALMLGCCKPNQLRQSDLAALYAGLQEWGAELRLETPPGGTGLFLVNLGSDQPPLYSALGEQTPGPQFRYIDTDALIEHLEILRAEQNGQGIRFDKDMVMPSNVLDHLIASLGSMSLRNFSRAPSGSSLWVSIGLSSTHYHVAGKRTFEQLLRGKNFIPPASGHVSTNPFLDNQARGDLWQQANPEEDYSGVEDSEEKALQELERRVELDEATRAELLRGKEDPQLPPQEHYPVYKIPVADASPGGYCLEWSDELPGDIRTGDIVSVKEQSNNEWAIAVIRWVSQLEDARTLIGLELMSPRAKAFGACIQQKTGEKSPPMRVLLLPEIKLVGQPHTLITPRANFRERQKVTLISGAQEHSIQLTRQVASTGNFAQFDFRDVRPLGDVLAEDKLGHLGSTYDSVWSNI